MTALVLRHDAAGVATLTLNRPQKLNALNTELFEELDAHLASLETQSGDIGCIVLRGAGQAFCVGADLAALQQGVVVPTPMYKTQVIERLAALPQPVMAAVHGYCFTGGLELALATDFILATDTATFADTHGKWGLVAAWGMSQRLPRRVGTAWAKRMMMTGLVIDAEKAQEIGLVDEHATADNFERLVAGWVMRILANSWHTNQQCKRVLLETDGLTLRAGLAHEFFRNPGPAPDMAQRIAAFNNRKN